MFALSVAPLNNEEIERSSSHDSKQYSVAKDLIHKYLLQEDY